MKAYEIREIPAGTVVYDYQNANDRPVTFAGPWGDPLLYEHVEVAVPSPLTNLYNE